MVQYPSGFLAAVGQAPGTTQYYYRNSYSN